MILKPFRGEFYTPNYEKIQIRNCHIYIYVCVVVSHLFPEGENKKDSPATLTFFGPGAWGLAACGPGAGIWGPHIWHIWSLGPHILGIVGQNIIPKVHVRYPIVRFALFFCFFETKSSFNPLFGYYSHSGLDFF